MTDPTQHPRPSPPDRHGLRAAMTRLPPALLVALFAALLFGPGIVGRELMPPDEPRYALVAAEMFESGDAVLPTRHGEPYLEKPPLLFWIVAAVFHLAGGPGEAAARVPSLVASVLLAAVAAAAAHRWFDRRTALLAPLLLATSSLVLVRSGWVVTDTLLAAAVLGCVVLLDAVRRGGTRLSAWGAALCLAAGLLAKGPIALLLVALAALASFAAPAPRLSLLPLLRPGSLALLAACLVPWPAALAWRTGDPGALLGSALRQTVTRFADSWDNLEPWWYYGEALLTGLLPWSLLAPLLLDAGARRRALAEPVTRWLLAWSALATLVLSFPAGKRGVYLLPLYPALAIVLARLVEAGPGRWSRRAVSLAAAVAAAALAAVATAFVVDVRGLGLLPERLPESRALRTGIAAVAAAWSLGLAGMSVAAVRAWRCVAVAPAVAALVVGVSAPLVVAPALDAAQGAREAARTVVSWTPQGAAVGACRGKRELLDWYLPATVVPLGRPEEIVRFLEAPGPRVVLCREERLPPEAVLPDGTSRIGAVRIGRLELHVLRRTRPTPLDEPAPWRAGPR